jgi:hypothetical protein
VAFIRDLTSNGAVAEYISSNIVPMFDPEVDLTVAAADLISGLITYRAETLFHALRPEVKGNTSLKKANRNKGILADSSKRIARRQYCTNELDQWRAEPLMTPPPKKNRKCACCRSDTDSSPSINPAPLPLHTPVPTKEGQKRGRGRPTAACRAKEIWI